MIRTRYVLAVDWFALMTDLIRCGVSIRKAADATDVPHFRLYRAYRGLVDLRHRDAEALISLWCDLTRRTCQDVPRVQSFR